MLELAEELHSRKHHVTVITTWPEYNLDQDYTPRSFSEKEIENGITVLRVKTLPHHNVNYLLRGIAQLLMPVNFFTNYVNMTLCPMLWLCTVHHCRWL